MTNSAGRNSVTIYKGLEITRKARRWRACWAKTAAPSIAGNLVMSSGTLAGLCNMIDGFFYDAAGTCRAVVDPVTDWALVEKKNHLALHSIFHSRERAEKYLAGVIPDYVARGLFMDKTLMAGDFEIVEYRHGE